MDELTKAKKVYRLTNELYGSRAMWIVNLAELLCISNCDAGTLTSACGYRRGRLETEVPFAEFCKTTGVAEVLDKIPNDAVEDRRHIFS